MLTRLTMEIAVPAEVIYGLLTISWLTVCINTLSKLLSFSHLHDSIGCEPAWGLPLSGLISSHAREFPRASAPHKSQKSNFFQTPKQRAEQPANPRRHLLDFHFSPRTDTTRPAPIPRSARCFGIWNGNSVQPPGPIPENSTLAFAGTPARPSKCFVMEPRIPHCAASKPRFGAEGLTESSIQLFSRAGLEFTLITSEA